MSITDELREWAWQVCPGQYAEQVISIANNIDKRHKEQIMAVERHATEQGERNGYVEAMGKVEDEYVKLHKLQELTQDFAPQVSISNCRGCTFNIYPSRNTWTEAAE